MSHLCLTSLCAFEAASLCLLSFLRVLMFADSLKTLGPGPGPRHGHGPGPGPGPVPALLGPSADLINLFVRLWINIWRVCFSLCTRILLYFHFINMLTTYWFLLRNEFLSLGHNVVVGRNNRNTEIVTCSFYVPNGNKAWMITMATQKYINTQRERQGGVSTYRVQ